MNDGANRFSSGIHYSKDALMTNKMTEKDEEERPVLDRRVAKDKRGARLVYLVNLRKRNLWRPFS